MWDLAVREEDYEAADAMLRRMKVPPPPLSMRILVAFARGDSAARADVLREAAASDSRQSQIAARYVATFLEDVGVAESLVRLDLAPRRRPDIRATAQLVRAWLELGRGRWSAAKALFAEAERMEEAPSVLAQRAIAATLPFLTVPRADLESIHAEVTRWDPIAPPSESNADLAVRLRPELRLYLLGLLSSRLGDHAGAMRLAGQIESARGSPELLPVIRALAQTVRADVALQTGNAEGARRALDSVPGEVPLELVSVPAYAMVRGYAQEHVRHLRVLTLRAQEEHTEALRWIETSFQGAPGEFVYLAPMHLERGEIYDRLGDRAKAAEHYRRFVALWGECDAAMRPRVEEAKARLARLD